jgi:hypothetical protein
MCQDVLMRARPPKRRPDAASRQLQAFNVPIAASIAPQHRGRGNSPTNRGAAFATLMSKNAPAHIVVMR